MRDTEDIFKRCCPGALPVLSECAGAFLLGVIENFFVVNGATVLLQQTCWLRPTICPSQGQKPAATPDASRLRADCTFGRIPNCGARPSACNSASSRMHSRRTDLCPPAAAPDVPWSARRGLQVGHCRLRSRAHLGLRPLRGGESLAAQGV